MPMVEQLAAFVVRTRHEESINIPTDHQTS